jgi:hypothetical protein
MRATVQGYAWSSHGMVQKAALGVLFLYVAFALGHVGYSAWTSWSSTSWDSAPEIMALAMNSQPTVDTVKPFKEKVNIRNRNGHLEFVFQDTRDDGSSVRPNAEYA